MRTKERKKMRMNIRDPGERGASMNQGNTSIPSESVSRRTLMSSVSKGKEFRP